MKTYKIDVKKIKVSGNIEPKVKKPENEWECWKTPRDQVPFRLSSEPWEVCFPWKPDTYDLLHAHSHWTSEDTYISIDCITYSRGWRTAVDRLFRRFGEYITNALPSIPTQTVRQTGTREFDLIHLGLFAYKLWICIGHMTWFKMGLVERKAACVRKKRGKATSAR